MSSEVEGFAREVGVADPVTVVGTATRGGPVDGARTVVAPAGIRWIEPEEMTIRCGAATLVDDVVAELAAYGQTIVAPPGGTIGGALAVGRSGIRRLGDGPLRDSVLQIDYVSAAGEVVKAGGPTVKNVSGFDLCRLLVGSQGTLGFFAEVIMRTRPLPRSSQWYMGERDPFELLGELYRPTSVLWDGARSWTLLEGVDQDRTVEAVRAGLVACDGPPELPAGGRWSLPPAELAGLARLPAGSFVAEVGVGVVHRDAPAPAVEIAPAVRSLHQRIKDAFDPAGRLNPGRDVLDR